jgi:hypothetical protein
MRFSPLRRVAELERQYNGPVPQQQRLAARLASPAALGLLVAEGEATFYKRLVLGQIRTIRARRADGTAYPELFDDLRFYRDGWRDWNRQRHALRGATALRE